MDKRLFRARYVLPLIAAGLLAVLTVAATGFASTRHATAPPTNQSPPTITGTPQTGQGLAVDTGNWSNETSFTYQWRRCDQNGGSCSDISGATGPNYSVQKVDEGNTLRVVVTAHNADGTTSRTTVPTAVITPAGAAQPQPQPQPQPTSNGCPKVAQGASSVAVSDIAAPARLQITSFVPSPGVITRGAQSFQLTVHVSDTCGNPVSGANVYATAVPFQQFSIPSEQPTGTDGSVTLTFNRMAGFPATPRQQLLALFVRATKPGDNVLAGISTRRLVSIRVNLHR